MCSKLTKLNGAEVRLRASENTFIQTLARIPPGPASRPTFCGLGAHQKGLFWCLGLPKWAQEGPSRPKTCSWRPWELGERSMERLLAALVPKRGQNPPPKRYPGCFFWGGFQAGVQIWIIILMFSKSILGLPSSF